MQRTGALHSTFNFQLQNQNVRRYPSNSLLGAKPVSPIVLDASVENLQFSLFLISCSQVILSSSNCTWYLFLKISCLHVSFTACENFYKLSKMHCLLVLTFHLLIFRMSECRNPTIKHIFTYTLVSPFINTYVTDLFLVIFFAYEFHQDSAITLLDGHLSLPLYDLIYIMLLTTCCNCLGTHPLAVLLSCSIRQEQLSTFESRHLSRCNKGISVDNCQFCLDGYSKDVKS